MAKLRASMSDFSPVKRRKTKGSFEKKKMEDAVIPWPRDLLPVELFELIISYLPRSSVQSMRSVNKEFESKVSAYLFKVVVVPFKPEIYGITPEPTLAGMSESQTRANEILHGAVLLQDKGMRVFQGFGSRIKKFAMSFEYDEKKLAHPPIKSDQEAIRAFWGIYRWPFKKYNRYTQLEGLEQTADETRTMAKALRYIDQASELGLSIDGGLGWLAGPDTNQKVTERGGKVSVFGESKFVPEEKLKLIKGKDKAGWTSSPTDLIQGQHATFQRMLQETGLNGDSLEAGVQMMIEAEDMAGSIGQWQDDLFLPGISNNFNSDDLTQRRTLNENQFNSNHLALVNPPQAQIDSDNDDDDDDDNEDDLNVQSASTVSKVAKPKTEGHLLKPNDLTNAQREMLLEIEWAQRAFMQSYAIAIIDNPHTFTNIKTLTIARIPNRHLPILRREDFWDSLPQVSKLSLAVIPDWRDVVKLPTSWVQDIKLAPSQSIAGVFQLLQEQISRRENIKTLRFEWLCGGEEVPGLFARNQHILAAPLVFKAMDMVNRSYLPQLLSLPYVEHLHLKNCWMSPHILTRLELSMKKLALQTLILESVSLTACLALNAQPNPLTGHAANNHHAMNNAAFLNLQNPNQNQVAPPVLGLPAPAPAPASTSINTIPDWLLPPRVGSWASVIETLTPGNTIAQVRHDRNYDTAAPEPRDTGNITKLEFKSCGYVRLPLDFDQTALDPPNVSPPQTSAISKRISDIDSFMMKPHDYTLGSIINHISDVESAILENVHNMNLGWGNDRQVLALEATADGVAHPGQGRFSGVIRKTQRVASS